MTIVEVRLRQGENIKHKSWEIVKAITYWLFILCLPVMLLTGTLWLGVNNTHIYEYSFHKYRISEETGISKAQLSEVARRLIDYFNSRVETPQITVTNEIGEKFELFQEDEQNRELTHLEDVRRLFQLAHIVWQTTLAYIIIYSLLLLLWQKNPWQDLAKGITQGCILILGTIAVLGIVSLFINFEMLFVKFHHLVFHNPYWISSGYLPRLFPEPFWQDIAFLGAATIAVEALLIGSIAWVIPVIYKRHEQRSEARSKNGCQTPSS